MINDLLMIDLSLKDNVLINNWWFMFGDFLMIDDDWLMIDWSLIDEWLIDDWLMM